MKYSTHERVNVNTVKKQNRAAVFEQLAVSRELTRTELAQRTNLSLGTVATVIEELVGQNAAEETKAESVGVGRKPNIVRLRPEGRRILTLDLSSRDMQYEVLNLDLAPALNGIHYYDFSADYESNLRELCRVATSRLSESRISEETVVGIGVAAPGPYSPETDTISEAPQPELSSVKLTELLGSFFKHPIVIDHDVFLATRAEVRNVKAYRRKNIFYLYLGEGVGGALASGGVVYRGAREDAGEVGNLLVCDSGRLEDLVSWNRVRARLLRMTAEADETWLRSEFARADSGVRELILDIADAVARALHNVVWITDPHAIVIAGAYQVFGEDFIDVVRNKLADYLPRNILQGIDMLLPLEGTRSAIVGAGEMVRERWLNSL